MAVYDPPQSLLKRNVAGILDFIFAATVLGLILYQFFPRTAVNSLDGQTHTFYGLQPWATLGLLVLVIAYFVVLGRTGGTLFQRLLGMKRA